MDRSTPAWRAATAARRRDSLQRRRRRRRSEGPQRRSLANLNNVDDELELISEKIVDWRSYSSRKNRQLVVALKQDTLLILQERRIIDEEIIHLKKESSYLVAFASFRGTVGNIHAQLNELIPSYKTILTLYRSSPSIIKAYAKEGSVDYLHIGFKVMVKSTNRDYNVIGQVLEIGYRVTEYPDRINPVGSYQKSYGQEIFIKIPDDNDFLNGEQVYVYPQKSN